MWLQKHEARFLIYIIKFKLCCKMSWLVGYRLPWQPVEKSGFMVLCVLSIYTHTPKMVTMRCIVFELRLFCCLANQSLCLVTIATRVKRNTFSKTRGHTLRTGMQHALTDVWESAKFRAEILYPSLKLKRKNQALKWDHNKGFMPLSSFQKYHSK